MALLTDFPQGYKKPEPLNKSFDMIVRDWSRQQFGGDAIVEEIRKALNTGVYSQIAGTTWSAQPGEASALRLENLDNTMTSVLATAEHLKVFRFLHKEPSKQPFYQWNRRESYGSTRGFFGFTEGGLPQGGKGEWSRNGAYVKFLGTKGGVTHPVVLTNILGGMSMDPVAEDQLGRTMDFMQRVERAVMFGDEAILDNKGTDTNYDGILKQLTTQRPRNVIDLKGKPLTLDTIADAATRLVTEGKLLSFQDVTLFMSPRNIEDLGKLRYSTIYSQGTISGPGLTVDRAELTTSARQNLIAGLSVVGQATSFGVIPFEWSIFTEPVEGGLPLNLVGNGAADPGAPSAPVALVTARMTVATSANATATSNFPTGPTVYVYAVSAVNDLGESLATVAAQAVTVSANQQVTLQITRVTGSDLNQARAYRIYRIVNPTAGASDVSHPDWRFVGYVADPNSGTYATWIDRNGTPELHNNFMPDTNIAPLICRNPADLCIAQMSPLLKMPLAPVSTTFEYLLLLYHTLVLKAPERQIVFKNVGLLT